MKKNMSTKQSGLKRFLHSEALCGYIFATPFIIGFLAFTIIPICISFYLSFTDYSITAKPSWVGLQNYVKMFTDDPRFLRSIGVTLYYVLVSVPLKLAFALVIAFVLTRESKAMGLYRSIYYLPSLIGGSVAVTLVWKELFATEGLINTILSAIGIPKVMWMGDPRFAIWILILLSAWQFGSSMIIFAAGLKQIPLTYYEAAKMDGANLVQQFFKITLPCLSPVILFNLVMQTISGFMSFTQAFIITEGGPSDSTLFYALYLYKHAFNYFQMGYASAMAWVLLVMVAIVTFIIFKTSDTWVFYEGKEAK